MYWVHNWQLLLPSLWEDQDPRLMQCSMGPQECSPQTASWSVQPFLHSEASVSCVTGRLTDTTIVSKTRLCLMHRVPRNNARIYRLTDITIVSKTRLCLMHRMPRNNARIYRLTDTTIVSKNRLCLVHRVPCNNARIYRLTDTTIVSKNRLCLVHRVPCNNARIYSA